MTMLYRELTQPELLERLEEKGFKVSSQTIRNWETAKLITKPTRGSRYGGRWVVYSEYVLIECYAAYHLLSINARRGSALYEVKCSPELLALARQNCRFHPQGLPPQPQDASYYDIIETPNNQKKLVSCHPPIYEGEKSTLRVTITDERISAYPDAPHSHHLHWDEPFPFSIDLKEHSFFSALETAALLTAELLWFKYLCQGAAVFFPENYKGGQ